MVLSGLTWVTTPTATPPDKPWTLAAYTAGAPLRCFVEPVAVGDVLPPLPRFFTPEHYVNLPLEESYQAAYQSIPRRWRTVLEAAPS
jgi:hypothetical protein